MNTLGSFSIFADIVLSCFERPLPAVTTGNFGLVFLYRQNATRNGSFPLYRLTCVEGLNQYSSPANLEFIV
jgi:hypothetical protein